MFAIHRQRETHLFDLPTEEIMKILHQFLLHVIVAFLSVDTHTHTHNHHLLHYTPTLRTSLSFAKVPELGETLLRCKRRKV